MSRVALLLTATIQPVNTPQVAITDFSVREIQYYDALLFYMQLNLPIVFVDNSTTHSTKIQSLIHSRSNCEYHTFSSQQSNKGKGHGEVEIIRYALDNSPALKQTEWIIKVTGRHQIENIKSIIEKVVDVDAEVLVNWGLNLKWADTRLIFFKQVFFDNYFEPMAIRGLDEPNKMYLENVFARSVHMLMAEGGISGQWPEYPFYQGVNGATGKPLRFSFIRKFKFRAYFAIKKWFLSQIV